MVFTTWRTFQHHIERGCQALLCGPAQCTANIRGVTPMLPGDRTRPQAFDRGMRGARMLTPNELEHLKTLNFGLRLLRVVHRREWQTLADDSDACAYLRTRCVLCAQHFTRIQELQQHYRQHHSDLWEHVPLKAQQLTNLHCADPPCGVCGALFRTHTCPVWTQVAMLLVNGACPDSDEATLETRCRCDICGDCFETPAALTQHLQQIHGLHGLTFNASRDAIDNSAACAHCGQTFTAMSSLKTHIVQDKCGFFNPLASAETKPVEELWKAACLRGQLYDVLTPAHNRLRLTLHCQCCPRIFVRANDLALHLQSAHSRLWRRAQRLTLLLVDAFYSQNACCCNPSTGVKRGNHVCLPLRQIAMAFHRLQQEPFAPILIGDRQLQATLSLKLPAAQRFLMEQLLTNGQFQALWTEDGALQILRACCLYCGVSLAPADLSAHLREEHQCHHELFMFYLDQLQETVLEVTPDIYQCTLCTQIFNLPWIHKPDEPAADRMALAQSHLRGNCPVLVNLALLFSYLFHGERNACTRDASTGSFSADHGSVQQPGAPFSRQHIEAGAQSAGHQDETQGTARWARRPSKKPRLRTDGDHGANQTAHGSCPPGHQTRSGTPKHAQTGSIHTFFEQRSNRRSPPADPGDGQLEETDGQPDTGATPAEATPDPLPGEVSSTPSGTDSQRTGDRPALSGVPAKGLDPAGSELPIPQMGSKHPEAAFGQEDSGQRQTDGTTTGGDPGITPGHPAGGSLSCLEGSPAEPDNSMETPTECPNRQGLRDFPSPLLQRGLDGGGRLHEATQLGAKQPSYADPESLGGQPEAGQGPRQGLSPPKADLSCHRFQLLQAICGLVMNNDSTWCYANSTVFSLMWTWLCAPSSTELWGSRFGELLQYFCQLDSRWVVLAEAPWFQQILGAWGPAHGQNDSAEFTQAVLAWLGMQSFDMRWERRVMIGTTPQVFDSSSGHAPITLTIMPSMHEGGNCDLTSMIQNWCQENSMTAALLEAPICLVLHVDRFFQDGTGMIQKSMSKVNIDAEVLLPVFAAETSQHEPVAYTPVAGITHFGADMAGHCQAVLKLQPGLLNETTPISWMITEDAREPEPTWRIPDHFAENINVIWLVRSDILAMPVYTMRPSTERQAPQQADNLLNLLQAQEGIQ